MMQQQRLMGTAAHHPMRGPQQESSRDWQDRIQHRAIPAILNRHAIGESSAMTATWLSDARACYVAVAAGTALLHIAVLIICDRLGIHYLPAIGASFIIVNLCGYTLHARFTFKHPVSILSLLRYALGMATNFP